MALIMEVGGCRAVVAQQSFIERSRGGKVACSELQAASPLGDVGCVKQKHAIGLQNAVQFPESADGIEQVFDNVGQSNGIEIVVRKWKFLVFEVVFEDAHRGTCCEDILEKADSRLRQFRADQFLVAIQQRQQRGAVSDPDLKVTLPGKPTSEINRHLDSVARVLRRSRRQNGRSADLRVLQIVMRMQSLKNGHWTFIGAG